MYIEPNTTIKILGDVRLKKDYKNTLEFDTSTAQYNYFNSKVLSGLTLTKQYYQRYDRGVISVNVDVSKLYGADYLMFQNNDFGSKWFYAFINNVEYVSTNVSRIYYEIDDLQSWWFNWDFGECFVERMHTPTDEVGDWLAEEPVTLCNPMTCVPAAYNRETDITYIVTCAFKIKDINADSYEFEDLNGGAVYNVGSSTIAYPFMIYTLNIEQYKRFVSAVYASTVDRKSEIVAIRIAPTAYIGTLGFWIDVNIPTTLNGYTPNNKKLLTSQFHHLKVSTGDTSKSYAYEFLNTMHQFKGDFVMFEPDPCLILTPRNTTNKLHWGNSDLLYCKLASTGFTVDTFHSNATSNVLTNVLPSLVESIGRAATSPFSMVSWGVNTASGLIKSYLAPNENVGTASNWSQIVLGLYPFVFYDVSIDYQDAKRLDTFFTAYGYQINEIIKPSTETRERVNYLKTKGCNLINVSCPVDVQDKICAIFDDGVSVWHSPDYLYVYYDENGDLLPNNIVV